VATEDAHCHVFLSLLFGTFFDWNSTAVRERETFASVSLTFDARYPVINSALVVTKRQATPRATTQRIGHMAGKVMNGWFPNPPRLSSYSL